MREDFIKLSKTEQENIYGGWAWLVTLVPMLIQGVVASISAVKMLQSDNGSFDYNGFEAEWSDNKPTSSRGIVKEFFYAL